MTVTATQLRTNIYQLLDQIIESGKPLHIERKGVIIEMNTIKKPLLMDLLPKRPCINGDSDDIIHMDWSNEWNETLP